MTLREALTALVSASPNTRGRPLVHFEFEHEDKAKEAHRVIGQAIAIAIKITPQV